MILLAAHSQTEWQTINYQLVCYVKGKEIDTARNNIIEAVEEKS